MNKDVSRWQSQSYFDLWLPLSHMHSTRGPQAPTSLAHPNLNAAPATLIIRQTRRSTGGKNSKLSPWEYTTKSEDVLLT